MSRKQINSWEGGMDQDTSKRLYPKNRYYHAKNVRIISSDELVDGSLHTYPGDEEQFVLPQDYSEHHIIGWGKVGKWTVLFSTENEGELVDDLIYSGYVYDTYKADYVSIRLYFSDVFNIDLYTSVGEYVYVRPEYGQKYKFEVNDITETSSGTYLGLYVGETNPETTQIFYLFNDSNLATTYIPQVEDDCIWKVDLSTTNTPTLVYKGALKLTMAHPIYDQVTGYYMNKDVQKIYWTDNNNYLRSINIADTDVNLLAPGKLDIIPSTRLSRPYLYGISGGSLPVGVVQYAYQLYRNDGSITTFSPVSGVINLTEFSESENNDRNYMGSGKLDDDGNPNLSGKSVSVKIDDIDLSYDKIRLVNLIYTELNTIPKVNIVADIPVSSSEIIITDNGEDYRGDFSFNLFRSLGGTLFKAKTINNKDNILFAGNIEESFLDVDQMMNTAGTGYWDARAYRWNADQTVKLFSDPNTTDHNNWTTKHQFQYTGDDTALEDFYNSIGEKEDVGNITNCPNQTIDERLDAFFYHNPGNEGYTGSIFIYQKDGQTQGGEGPNVKYEFVKNIIYKQNFFTRHPRTETPKGDFNQNLTSYTSYRGPSNPLIASLYNGFKSDEIYSFGLKFYNDKMQESFVKWIGDIRFPRRHEMGMSDMPSDEYFDYTNLYPLGIKFTINTGNLPSDITHVQLVRCPRKRSDRTIISQGMAFFPMLYKNSTPNTLRPHWYPTARIDSNWVTSSYIEELQKNIYLFQSPDLYYGNTIEQTDWAVQVQKMAGAIFYSFSSSGLSAGEWIPQYAKSDDLSSIWELYQMDYNAVRYSFHENMNSVEPVSVERQTIVSPASESGSKVDIGHTDWAYVNWYETYDSGEGRYGPHGTTLALKMSANLSNVGDEGGEGVLVDLKKERIPYGGYGYYKRKQREYIPASDIVAVTSGEVTIETYEGDTYLDYTEHIKNLYHDSGSAMHTRILYPLESSINPKLVDRTYSIAQKSTRIYKQVQESSGYYKFDDENPLEQLKDFYIYNSIYSKQNDSQISIPKPDEELYTKNRYIVKASNRRSRYTLVDEWTNFTSGNELMVDTLYGPINRLVKSGNALLYFQDNSFGTLSINERALQKSLSGAQLELGSSGVLARYDPISLEAGCQHINGVMPTDRGIYWYDQSNKKFWLYRDGLADMGKKAGMQSFFRSLPQIGFNIFNDTEIVIGKNTFYDELWITIFYGGIRSTENYDTLIYNYALDRFISFLDNRPEIYIFGNEGFFETHAEQLRKLDQETYFLRYLNFTPEVTFLVSPKEFPTAMFNVITWLNEKYSDGSPVHDSTIETIAFENDHQQSEDITVLPYGQGGEYNTRRMNRVWKFDTIRDNNDNHMIDYYLKVTMKWKNQKFVLHTVETYYKPM